MSTPPGSNGLPVTGRRKTHWPGLVWAVPVAALLIVIYLGLHAWARRGEVITVTFDRAADAKPGETKVLYEGVEAGHLLKIVPNKDGHRLDFQLRLSPEAKAGLNSNARFWLIGASPNLADLSSLKAVVSGVAIGYAPGEGGAPQTTFDGLEKAPTVLPGDRGTRYQLESHTLGSIREGSGLLVSRSADRQGDARSNSTASPAFTSRCSFFEPYDALIKPATRFLENEVHCGCRWPAAASMSVSLRRARCCRAGSTWNCRLPTPGAAKSPADAKFTLYANRDAARQGLSGPTVRYDFAFSGAAGELEEEAPVTLLGFQIGQVETTRLRATMRKPGRPFTTVTRRHLPAAIATSRAGGRSRRFAARDRRQGPSTAALRLSRAAATNPGADRQSIDCVGRGEECRSGRSGLRRWRTRASPVLRAAAASRTSRRRPTRS